MTTLYATPTAGKLLRGWRERRRLSQLQLSIEADVSARHLSFLETGRSMPTREMIHRLADHLEVPLRERNDLLLAAGFAPAYPHRTLGAPELRSVSVALSRILELICRTPRSSWIGGGTSSTATARRTCSSTDARRSCWNLP